MEAAALILLVAGVGVGYGWQPMSDGSARYEYTIQVEPELLATLESGQAIPIVSEVPDDVKPIGRIRIVVGRGDLPRERLRTAMKPADGGAAMPPLNGDKTIDLAQYSQYGPPGSRYAQAAPTAGATAAASDASSWNGDGGAVAASGSNWNTGAAADGPMGKVGDTIDQATAPVRDGFNRLGDQTKAAVGNLGARTQNLVDELGRPLQRTSAADARSLPTGTNPNQPAAPTWNADAGAAAASTAQNPAGRYTPQANSWNGDSAAPAASAASPVSQATPFSATTPTGRSGVGASNNPNDAAWNSSPGQTASGSSAPRLDQPVDPKDVGRWDNAATSPGSTAAGGPTGQQSSILRDPGTPNLLSPTNGRDFPSTGNTSSATADSRQQPFSGTGSGASPGRLSSDWSTGGAKLPGFEDGPGAAPGKSDFGAATKTTAIDKAMLDKAATRPLEGTDGSTAPIGVSMGPAFPSGAGPSFPATDRTSQTTTAAGTMPTTGAQPTGPAGQGWDWATRMAGGATAPANGANQPAGTTSARQTAAVLMAWVLLCGSIAGNLYLFWSYQDVRYKYRSLVRKSARTVGNRMSPA